LVNSIHEDLTGDLAFALSKSHFDLLEERTGLSKRKLKEIFGIYKPRSQSSHEYTMDQLAQFAGYKSWNDFIKSHTSNAIHQSLSQKRQTVLNKKVSIQGGQQQHKVQISILVK
jgi:hypothetical protein